MTGYISIQRKLREHWLYKEDRIFSKFEAWIDILYEVNHTDNKFLFDGSLVEVKRGSTITSLRKMSEKWKWSITKVNAFLKMLEEDEMLVVKKDTKKTLLTVVNYDFYQSEKCKKEQQSNTEVTQKRHRSNTEKTQKKTNNNELIITNNELIITNNELKESKDIICVLESEKIPYKEIIEYLNIKTESSYKHTTPKTKELIKTRWNEGFLLDDFKACIDNQVILWLNDPKMNKYLRPETLFGTKFESYVNAKIGASDKGLISKTTEKGIAVLQSWASKKEAEE